MDKISVLQRSRLMARIPSKNTKPELAVRSLLHAAGYRFRLHARDLPGKPDIIFPKRKKIIFVHGCFWHGHLGCKGGNLPTSRVEFWQNKIDENRKRDANVQERLIDAGWQIFIVWQCALKENENLQNRIFEFLGPPRIL